MKASERMRRYREDAEAEARRSGMGAELGYLIGMAAGGGVAFVVAQLLDSGSDPWWIYAAAGGVVGLCVARLVMRAAAILRTA